VRTPILLLVLALPGWAADCTLALGANNPKNLSATGDNGGGASMWTGAGCTALNFIPGIGDTVVDITGTGTSKLTINQAWDVGSSPAAGVDVVSFSAPLECASSFNVRGSLAQKNATMTWLPGCIYSWDPSSAGDITSLYTWHPTAADQANSVHIGAGTSGSHVTIYGVNPTNCSGLSCGHGAFTTGTYYGANRWYGSGGTSTPATYVDFIGVGDASTPSITIRPSNAESNVFRMGHCTFTSGGGLATTGSLAAWYTWTINLSYLKFQDTKNSYMMTGLWYGPPSGGTRSFDHIVSDVPLSGSGFYSGLSITDSIMGRPGNVCNDATYVFGTIARDLFVYRGTAVQSGVGLCGSMDKIYYAWDSDANNPNAFVANQLLPATISNFFFEQLGNNGLAAEPGDAFIKVAGAPASAMNYVHTTGVYAPSLGMYSGLRTGLNSTTLSCASCTNSFVEQTHVMQYGVANGGIHLENTTTSPNTVKYRSNYNFFDASLTGYKIYITGVVTSTDVCVDARSCDYNADFHMHAKCLGCSWQKGSNQDIGYAAIWTSPVPGHAPGNIGEHDIDDVNGNLVDDPLAGTMQGGRSLANFDQLYLKQPVATAWNIAGAYAYGALVSHATATLSGGATFNYRCNNLVDCNGSATSEPGVGATWRTYWEWAGYQWIRDSIYNNTTYTDGAVGAVNDLGNEVLRKWAIWGYTISNPLLWCAGHDGETIGAVPFCARGKALLAAM
jgi:hypothetical protein